MMKSSDVVIERRPKAEVGADAAARDRAVGMQARRSCAPARRSEVADLAKPDLVQRDQNVTLIYEVPGSTSPCAARRWKAAPKATSSTCSTCNPSARCPAS
jgi:hypothetical protein